MKYITRNIEIGKYADIPIIVTVKDKKLLRPIHGLKAPLEDSKSYFGVLGYIGVALSIQIYYDPNNTKQSLLCCIFAKDFHNAVELTALRFSDENIYLDVQKDEWDK